MSDPFVGEVRAVAFNFAPVNWALCDGTLLPISQYQALFSLLGTTFGGNGTTNFALPDYRGRSPVGMGAGPGLTPIVQGQQAGAEQVSLTQANMPMHTHTASAAQRAADVIATVASPNGAVAAQTSADGRSTLNSYAAASAANVNMGPIAVTVQPAGGSAPVPVRSPFLGTNFIIATNGIFPSRP